MVFDTLKLPTPKRDPQPSDRWIEAGVEPRLSDVMTDPLVHQVMRRDRLERADLEAAVALGRRLLRRRLCSLCAA